MKIIVITSPKPIKDEALICNTLFAYGLERLHLRKPDAGEEVYKNFIERIEPRYRNRIVLHAHYHLAQQYRLCGIHLKSGQGDKYVHYRQFRHISISCHSPEEIRQLPFTPEYCFLSPVFDSISKAGYKGRFGELSGLETLPLPIVALGGVTPENLAICRDKHFYGAAVLGYIWEKPEEALPRFLQLKTPVVMSIAGFDPSSGAGVTADLRTFENCGVYGLGICSGITFQNQDSYEGTCWTAWEDIRRQCELQFVKNRPRYIKIGLIENFDILDTLTAYLHERLPETRIIWDPILKASAGFRFHDSSNKQNIGKLKTILKRLYLITPNAEEIGQLFGNRSVTELQDICRSCGLNILWKGGHSEDKLSTDKLITPDNLYVFAVERGKYGKHGTGCVLSAAITARLAQALDLAAACSKAQVYVSAFMDSNNSKLGFHYIQEYGYVSKPSPRELTIQYITDHKEGITIGEQVEAVCRGGISWVQLRMKDASDEELLTEGRLVKEICKRYHALFIVNDNVKVARQLNADGVHLGKEDMNPLEARKILGPDKIIGATCNTWEDVILRAAQQVDYIGLGPFTFTTTKKKLSPVLGIQGYNHILELMQQSGIYIPVFAIGGITETDIPPLLATGIQGIALSGLIKNSNDLTVKTQDILKIINNTR